MVGGDDASSVAKVLGVYFKDTNKVPVKAGTLGDRILSAEEVKKLAKLPDSKACAPTSQFVQYFRTQLVGVLSAPSRGLVTVLKAKADNN